MVNTTSTQEQNQYNYYHHQHQHYNLHHHHHSMDVESPAPIDISELFAHTAPLNESHISEELLLPLVSTDFNYPPLYPTALYPPMNAYYVSPWEDSSTLFNPSFNPFNHPFGGFPTHPHPASSEPIHVQPSLIAPPHHPQMHQNPQLNPSYAPQPPNQQQTIFQQTQPLLTDINLNAKLPPMTFASVPSFKPSTFITKKAQENSNYTNTNTRRQSSNRPFGPTGETNPDGVIVSVYSNIQVYEFYCNGTAVMRRYDDNWVNATHILKVADIDKGKRTKILDRELQGDKFEKVQGGYGRYQGTWVPLERARQLARDYGVEEALLPIFELKDVKH